MTIQKLKEFDFENKSLEFLTVAFPVTMKIHSMFVIMRHLSQKP